MTMRKHQSGWVFLRDVPIGKCKNQHDFMRKCLKKGREWESRFVDAIWRKFRIQVQRNDNKNPRKEDFKIEFHFDLKFRGGFSFEYAEKHVGLKDSEAVGIDYHKLLFYKDTSFVVTIIDYVDIPEMNGAYAIQVRKAKQIMKKHPERIHHGLARKALDFDTHEQTTVYFSINECYKLPFTIEELWECDATGYSWEVEGPTLAAHPD